MNVFALMVNSQGLVAIPMNAMMYALRLDQHSALLCNSVNVDLTPFGC